MLRTFFLISILALQGIALFGCVVYEPYTVSQPANFDRAWHAALVVARQADGSVRVQFDAKGQTQRDPGLSQRFSQAYDRRMGR